MRYKVTYTVKFETVIEVPEGSTVQDEAANIEIPEGPGGKYIEDSFEVDETEPTNEPASNA